METTEMKFNFGARDYYWDAYLSIALLGPSIQNVFDMDYSYAMTITRLLAERDKPVREFGNWEFGTMD